MLLLVAIPGSAQDSASFRDIYRLSSELRSLMSELGNTINSFQVAMEKRFNKMDHLQSAEAQRNKQRDLNMDARLDALESLSSSHQIAAKETSNRLWSTIATLFSGGLLAIFSLWLGGRFGKKA